MSSMLPKIAVFAGLAVFIPSIASAETYSRSGHTMELGEFQPQTLDVTVATDHATGHKMNLIRLKNGHMMALIPADRYFDLMAEPGETLTGGPAGGLTDKN